MPELRAELRALGLDDQGVRRSLVERGAAAGRHGKNGINGEQMRKNHGKTRDMWKTGKTMGRAWEKLGKPWENKENIRKPWENMEKVGQV